MTQQLQMIAFYPCFVTLQSTNHDIRRIMTQRVSPSCDTPNFRAPPRRHTPARATTTPPATHRALEAHGARKASLAMSSSSYDSGFNEGVRALTTMFPDIDPHTIRTVLDARDGHVESAVEKLLAMSRRGGGTGGGAAPGAMGMSPMRCVCERVVG